MVVSASKRTRVLSQQSVPGEITQKHKLAHFSFRTQISTAGEWTKNGCEAHPLDKSIQIPLVPTSSGARSSRPGCGRESELRSATLLGQSIADRRGRRSRQERQD